jgi:hypothetical protein
MAKAMSTDLSADGRAITANALKCGPGVPETSKRLAGQYNGLSFKGTKCLDGPASEGNGLSERAAVWLATAGLVLANRRGGSLPKRLREFLSTTSKIQFTVGGYGVVPFHKRTRRGLKTAQENGI